MKSEDINTPTTNLVPLETEQETKPKKKLARVKCEVRYYDKELERIVEVGERIAVSKERAKVLRDNKVVL